MGMKHKTWGELLQVRSTSSLTSNGTVGSRETVSDDLDEAQQQQRQERKERRYNILHTVFVCVASFACGMVVSQRGPTILPLGHLVHTDLQYTASFFALGAGGHLAGCLATGLAIGRFRAPLFLFWALLGLCVTTAGLPWCQNFGTMATVYFFSLFFVGCVETGSYVDVAKRWSTQGGRILYLIQLSFVFGGVVSPALTQFFLTSKHYTYRTTLINSNKNSSSETVDDVLNASVFTTTTTVLMQEASKTVDYFQRISEGHATTAAATGAVVSAQSKDTLSVQVKTNNVQTSSSFSTDSNSTEHDGDYIISAAAYSEDSRIVYAYVITAAVAFAAAIPFALGHRIFRKEQQTNRKEMDSKKRQRHRERTAKVLPILLAAGAFFFCVSAVEESFHQFIAPFMIEDQHWVPTASGLVTTWFWCGVLLVRISALLIPSSVEGEEQGMTLGLSCALLPASLVALHLAAVHSARDGLWACVFFVGMSSSLIFPAAFTWFHSAFPFVSPGAVSAVVMLCTALAGIVNPLIIGGGFQHRTAGSLRGKGAFCFLLIVEACLALLAFIILRVLASRGRPISRSSRKKGRLREDEEVSMEIEVSAGRFEEVHDPIDIEDKET